MKKKITSILLNQYFLTGLISLGIIYFLPQYFKKYSIELISMDNASSSKIYFEDLNNDSKDELIMSHPNTSGLASFTLKDEEGLLIDQWNFSGKFLENYNRLSFIDTDSNGFAEIYILTQESDSIFLNIIEPFVNKGIDKKVFIDKITNYDGNHRIWGSEIIEHSKEILFTLNSGFGGNIRNAYKFSFYSNKIIKSPHLTNNSVIRNIIDIDNDGLDEIIMINYSSCNSIDSIYTKRSDYSSWLTVLNNNLEFEFNPIQFNKPFSSLYLIPFISKNKSKIICLAVSRDNKSKNSTLNIFSNKGELLKKKEIPIGNYFVFRKPSRNNFLLYNSFNGKIQEFDNKLNEINSFFIEPKCELLQIDIDGKKEWIALSRNKNNITIYRNNFKNALSFETEFERTDNLQFGLRQLNNTKNQLVFQKGDSYVIYNYLKNPYYPFRFFIYLSILLGVYGFVWLIIQGQKMRMNKKLAIQSEIAEYQIKTIKNQVDPHFVFNTINTISGLMLDDNKLKADELICQFSDLMRLTLENSDKITCTLQQEIDYVKHFIQLQQTRFNQKFSYQLNIDKSVNVNQIIPKHILYKYVENAIKHGFTNSKKGELTIQIKEEHHHLILIIDNKGDNLKILPKSNKNSTGNGLKIMEKMYGLYAKLYKKKIKHKINTIFDAHNNEIGYSVKITIFK